MAIKTMMSGAEIDRNLKAILDAQNQENNGLVIYIRKGELAFEDGEVLFDVAELIPVNQGT